MLKMLPLIFSILLASQGSLVAADDSPCATLNVQILWFGVKNPHCLAPETFEMDCIADLGDEEADLLLQCLQERLEKFGHDGKFPSLPGRDSENHAGNNDEAKKHGHKHDGHNRRLQRALGANAVGDFFYGLFNGMASDESFNSTCVAQLAVIESAGANITIAALNVTQTGIFGLFETVSTIRVYFDVLAAGIDKCKIAQLYNRIADSLTVEAIVGWGAKYAFSSEVYNALIEQLKDAFANGEWELAGDAVGQLFQKLLGVHY
jgi:hypothetical protein